VTPKTTAKAEAVGFDALWLYDHLLYRVPDQLAEGSWEARAILSALAEATTRVEGVHMNSATASWAIDRSAIVASAPTTARCRTSRAGAAAARERLDVAGDRRRRVLSCRWLTSAETAA
jgi:hypothetical protein